MKSFLAQNQHLRGIYSPRGWVADVFHEQSRLLYEIGTSEEHARMIFGENLVNLLG